MEYEKDSRLRARRVKLVQQNVLPYQELRHVSRINFEKILGTAVLKALINRDHYVTVFTKFSESNVS